MKIILSGLLLPFIGTAAGALSALPIKQKTDFSPGRSLSGFAGGIMSAAAIWSLIIPSIEQSSAYARFAFFPAAFGICIGGIFFLFSDKLYNKIDASSGILKTYKMILAVVLHNIPEGMAVGVVLAGYAAGIKSISARSVLTLAMGIAIQNFPEGAIVSMPLTAQGAKKRTAVFCGIMSGAAELAAGGITLLLSDVIIPVLPYLLSFAAGAMIYVVNNELLPETAGDKKPSVLYFFGFTLMMSLDVAFG